MESPDVDDADGGVGVVQRDRGGAWVFHVAIVETSRRDCDSDAADRVCGSEPEVGRKGELAPP